VDSFLLQSALQTNFGLIIRAFSNLITQPFDFSQLFNLKRHTSGILEKRKTDALVFRPAEVLVKIQRFPFSG
jgi:hypothetical protein